MSASAIRGIGWEMRRGISAVLFGLVISLADVRGAQIDIVIFAGQSNMTGAGADYTGVSLPGDGALAEYFYDTQGGTALANRHTSNGQFTTLQGVNFQAEAGDPELTNRFGPEIGFARKANELDSSVNLAIVKISFGNSLMVDWLKAGGGAFGNAYNDRLIAGVNAAKTVITGRGDTPVIRGFVWGQGESDAFDFNNHSQFYQERLGQFVSDVRIDLGEPNLPFLAIELGSNLATGQVLLDAFNAEQSAYLASDANAVLVSTTGLPLNPSDRRHWEASEMVTVGERAAQTFHDNFAPVPEPVHGLLVGLGLVGWGVWRRRRR